MENEAINSGVNMKKVKDEQNEEVLNEFMMEEEKGEESVPQKQQVVEQTKIDEEQHDKK